jgi:membrane protease YdiL (CAAX protease family)
MQKADPHSRLAAGFKGPSVGLHWCALIFAMIFPGLMAWVYFVALARPTSGDGGPVLTAFPAYVMGKIVQFGFPVVWVWIYERQRLRSTVPSFAGLALGIGFGLLVAALVFAAYHVMARSPILAETPEKIRDKLTVFHADTAARYLLLGVFIAGVHSLMEEYYWRWFVFGELKRRVPVAFAIALSSLAFMAHHVVVLGVYFPQHFFTAALPFALCVAVGGAVWAWLYQRTGTIYSAWISHLLVDAAILAVGYRMVFASPLT